MTSFIHDVLVDLKNDGVDFSQLTFILPSKRAGTFLKHELSNLVTQTIFSPSIISIEEFVEQLSGLKQLSNTELLFEFYETYSGLTQKDNTDSFDTFSKWAQILLQDFNEIDRYLIPSTQIFDYLSAIQDLNHWSLEAQHTPLIKSHLVFWKNLNVYYNELSNKLINKGLGYQGLIYKEAVENIESYIQFNLSKQHVFLGFNALNTAETTIIKELLQNGLAKIYWDTDKNFVNIPYHDAGLFIRQYKNKWNFLKNNSFKWLQNNYSTKKNISVVGIPKNIGQAKYIGELIQGFISQNKKLNNTAIVLGDENLLIPMLNSLPNEVEALNITMGFPLKSIPLASLFDQLLMLHQDNNVVFHYKDVIALFSHQFIRPLCIDGEFDFAEKLIRNIHNSNLIFLTREELVGLIPEKKNLITLLFGDWKNNSKRALNNCLKLIVILKTQLNLNKENNLLSLEYLFRFNEIFNTINTLITKHQYVDNIKGLYSLYKEVLSTESLDFQGEPLRGLQIMGMLESRVLDFETVIITSVNEGILPSGKSNNSFIPFDVKLENGLPTYKEKDAVYTYHFYRLLQRAKNVYIIYNTEPDVLTGGERSRFITQLEIEGIHSLKYSIVTPKTPQITTVLNRISKTDDILNRIKEVAKKGLSPSSLSNYIRNPLDFYYQKILGIKEPDDAEETVAANTLGTVVHNVLEDFYKPLEGQLLTIDLIKKMQLQVNEKVTQQFKLIYKDGDITKGKNLIIFEIAKRYVNNFLKKEIEDLQKGNTIKIIEIETNLRIDLDASDFGFPIVLTGKVDRVDEHNGTLRIIDYKTGKVEQGKVEIIDWNDITTDYTKYSKSFQVLMYAYMMHCKTPFNTPIEGGIISFKNLNGGFLKFAKKDKAGSYAKKDTLITQETLEAFETELKNLILEINNPEIDFIEKEI